MDHGTWDAPEVSGYGEAFGVSPSKMTVNVPQDNVMKYADLHFGITLCYEINRYLPFFCV